MNNIVALLGMLQNGSIESIMMNGMDIIFNPNMNGGEWELFDSNGNHEEYISYTDIYECASAIIELA